MQRNAQITRNTKETRISLELTLSGEGNSSLKTGLPFFDHMLDAMARHGNLDLNLVADGDLEIDPHHTIEDVGLVFGQALKKALGDKLGVTRFGHAYVPMDETLARVVIDLSGRPCLNYNIDLGHLNVGGIPVRLFHEFFQAVVNTGGMTLHVDLIRGEELHHIFEAVFKAFGRALDTAVSIDPKKAGRIPSTKGVLE